MNNEKVTLFWNRNPGVFVNKNTGEGINLTINGKEYPGPTFEGSQEEWNECLVETLIDVRNQLHRAAEKNSREIVIHASPEVKRILETSVLYKPASASKNQPTDTLCGMIVVEKRSVAKNEAEVEFKTGTSIERGRVKVIED